MLPLLSVLIGVFILGFLLCSMLTVGTVVDRPGLDGRGEPAEASRPGALGLTRGSARH
jgi:hypothetical protein